MKILLRFFSSLRLTMFLLATSVLLVFLGTLDQVHYGIWYTQQKYFNSFVAVWQYPEQFPSSATLRWIHLPLPGGFAIGILLVINLCCAHFRYFRARWDKAGIALIHGGLVALLLGQLGTQLNQVDSFMWLSEGESKNFIEAFHYDELVVIDLSATDYNRVYSVPVDNRFKTGRMISHPDWPFSINLLDVAPNAIIVRRDQAPASPFRFNYTHGIGADRSLIYFPVPRTFKEGERNVLTASVQLENASGTLATLLVANIFRNSEPMREPFPPQIVEVEGKRYEVALRFKRTYIPADITLRQFNHDRYPGTDIPYNFSSEITLTDNSTGNSRDSLIYMNNPLRFAGLTFYQASFAQDDTMSMFQVVRNPARWIPYVASAVISIGLLLQFCLSLFRHLQKRRTNIEASVQ